MRPFFVAGHFSAQFVSPHCPRSDYHQQHLLQHFIPLSPRHPHHFVTQLHLILCQSSLLHHFIPHPSAPITADIIPSNVLSHRYIWFQLNVLDGTSCILKHILFHLKRFRGTKCLCQWVLFHVKRFRGTKCLCQWVLFHVKRFRGTKLKTPGPTSRQTSHSITTPRVSSTILQHHNLSFSASLVTLIILSHIPVRIIAGISLPRPSEKSSRD